MESMTAQPEARDAGYRKRRNKRVTSAVLALILAAAAIVGAVGIFRSGGGEVSAAPKIAPTITTSNAADLQHAWSVSTGERNFIADGHQLFIVRPGLVEAFPEACVPSGGTCPPDWTGRIAPPGPDPADRLYGVVDGVVYASSGFGGLFAFPADCGAGGAVCAPLWSAQIGEHEVVRSVAVSGGVVFAGATDGYIRAYSTDCSGRCDPTWIGDVAGAWRDKANYPRFPVAVSADGGVVAATTGFFTFQGTTCTGDACHLHGVLATFGADCATGGATCAARWTYTTARTFTAGPVISDGVVLVEDAGVLAFPAECASPCVPEWKIPVQDSGTPVVADGVVYVTGSKCKDVGGGQACGSSSVGAYPLHCVPSGGTCAPIWTGPGVGTPVVADGVVVAGGGGWWSNDPGGAVYPVGCGTGGAECEPRWTPPGSAPVVSNGLLYFGGASLQIFDLACVLRQPHCKPLWVGPKGTAWFPIATDTALYAQDLKTRAVSTFTVPADAAGSSSGA